MKKVFIILTIVLLLIGLGCGPGEQKSSFEVKNFRPEGETGRETVISLDFNRPIMEDIKLLNVPIQEEFIRFTPPIIGEYRWLTESTLQFMPFERLSADTKYEAVLIDSIEEKDIGGKKNFSFYTPPFELVRSNIFFDYFIFDVGTKNIIIELKFNYDVDVEDIKRYVRLFNNNEDFPYEVTTDRHGTNFRLVTPRIKKDHTDQVFKMVVNKELPNSESGTTLGKSVTRELRLDKIPDFALEAKAVEKKGNDNLIYLRFNKIPDPAHIESYLSVSDVTDPKDPSPVPEFTVKVDLATCVLAGNFLFGRSYQISVAKDLKALDGSSLKEKASAVVVIPKPPKEIRFLQAGSLLPVKEDINLFVNSYDVPELDVQVYRVPENNISPLMHNREAKNLGEQVFSSRYPVDISDEFSSNITEINLKSFITKHGKGLYRVLVRDKSGWPAASKWFLGTDMGLILKKDSLDMHLYCASLKTFDPLGGVEVALLNRAGETVLSGKTDAGGYVVFKDYKDGFLDQKPWLVTARQGDDFAYLFFKEAKINLTNFDIEGAPYSPGTLEAFVYPSRNLFRPGEEIYIAARVNKLGGAVPAGMPVKLNVYNPQSVSVFSQNNVLNDLGMCEYSFRFPTNIKTGTYSVKLLVGDNLVIGKTAIKLEEFIPQTLKVNINVDEESLKPGLPLKYDVNSTTLFGSPAAGRFARSTVTFTHKAFNPPGYNGFSFDNSRYIFSKKEVKLAEEKLDEEGMIMYETEIPSQAIPFGLMNARIYTEVQEKGGRIVGRAKDVELADKDFFLGVKHNQASFASLNEPDQFEIAVLNRKGYPVTVKNVEVYIIKHGWYNIYQKANWQKVGKYESKGYEQIVFRKHIPLLKGRAVFSYLHENLGAYEIVVIQKESQISANTRYTVAGEGQVDVQLEKSGELKLQLDRDDYSIGDTAKLSVQSPFGGLLLLTVEREKILYRKLVKINTESNIVNVPIIKDFMPNAYITVQLYRSYNHKDPTLPVSAYGVIPLKMNRNNSRLKLGIDLPSTITPYSVFDVTVTSNRPAEKAYVTLSTVEEGVLDITNFHVPYIYDYFMRKRALGVESFDTLSDVVSNLPQLKGDITIGGGGGDYIASEKHLNPLEMRRRKTVALWSGLVPLVNGKAVIKVKVGDYNGSLRFMAVSASLDNYGQAEVSKAIYAPFIIQPTVPRTIAPHDRITIPVSVFNKTGGTQDVSFFFSVDGPLTLKGLPTSSFTIENNKEEFFDFILTAGEEIGVADITFSLKSGNSHYTQSDSIGIRPGGLKVVEQMTGKVAPGEKSVIIPERKYYDYKKNGHLQVASFFEAEFLANLDYLLGYPYGCLEQSVSIAFPQLYISSLARAVSPFLYKEKNEKEYIEAALNTVENYFQYDQFELWQGYGASFYLHVYVSHFLVEARRSGFEVKNNLYDRSLEHLAASVRGGLTSTVSQEKLHEYMYALYVLAPTKYAMRESMEFAKDVILDKDANIVSRLYLAAAYSLLGDKATAIEILDDTQSSRFPENFNWWKNPYLSDIAALSVIAQTLVSIDVSQPALTFYLEKLRNMVSGRRRLNTHEASHLLQVYSRLFAEENLPPMKGKIVTENKEIELEGNRTHQDTAALGSGEVVLHNDGEAPFYYSYYSDAYPLRQGYTEESSRGMTVKHSFFDIDGKPLKLNNIIQGSLVVTKLEVTGEQAGNAIISLLFPGGLEIENPRLKKNEELKWIPKYNYHQSDYIHITEDRLLIYTDFSRDKNTHIYYFAFRAVFPGDFLIPPVFAEDMYNGDVKGWTAAERIYIGPKE